MAIEPKGIQVSAELQKVLDGITGIGAAESSKFQPAPESGGAYPQCTWFNGCYYCKYSEFGPWYLIYCIA